MPLIIASKKLVSHVRFYLNIFVYKSHENPLKYVDTVTICVHLDHLGSMTADDPRWSLSWGHMCAHTQYPLVQVPWCGYSHQLTIWGQWLQMLPIWALPHFWHMYTLPKIVKHKRHKNLSKYVEIVSNFAEVNILAHLQGAHFKVTFFLMVKTII